ncbi:hypothetical protein [Croceicoccus bisphenolivorans]|uniref:hypothetical protein n=1 Tax=Croceicoccus bisphenolivorans TaxID=1783232 RepID=UPI000829A32F|nr:hypothetical protein [Croceicoccus bisphenolivorans]
MRTVADSNERALEDARERLGRNAGDVAALRDAIQAAMRLGKLDMAGLYALRAQQLAPKDPVIMAARGAIQIHEGRPKEGLALFAQADKAGVAPDAFVADRALGYDLIGDQPSAQYYYAVARRQSPDDEVLRRYALSLAIIGDFDTGDAMLRPLLNVQDRPAWRIHAFMLAINGRAAEAKDVLATILPAELATQLGPYMDAMPRLSRAQQAAAANLGLFPALAGLPQGVAGQPAMASRAPRRRPDAAPVFGTSAREGRKSGIDSNFLDDAARSEADDHEE